MIGVWPFVGRVDEMAEIRAAARDRVKGGLLIAGPAGVGKSRLLREACADWDVVSVQATRAGAGLPLGAFAPHLPPDPPVDTGPAGMVRWAAEALAGRVIAVDDAHLLDDASATLLLHLAAAGRAFLLLTVRSREPAPDAITALWKDDWVARLELGPFTVGDVRAALPEIPESAVRRLHRLTGGNALMLRELTLSGDDFDGSREKRNPRGSGAVRISPRLAELVHDRLAGLGADELAVLEYLSLGEPVGLATLTALTSAEACEAVEEAQLAAVVPDGRRTQIRLAHPIYGEVIRASCPVLRARRRQAELAAATEAYGHRRRDDVMRIAAWRLESGTATEPGPLLTAAALAYAVSDLSLALRLAEAAVAAGGGLDAALTLAEFRIWSAQPEEAAAALALADLTGSDELQRTRYAVNRAINLGWGLNRLDEALRVLDEEAARQPVPELAGVLVSLRAAQQMLGGQWRPAVAAAAGLLGGPALPSVAAAQAHGTLVHVRAVTGDVTGARTAAEAAMATVDEWASQAPFLQVGIDAMLTLAHLLAGELPAAERAAGEAYERLVTVGGWPWALGCLSMARGWAARYHGRVVEAVRWQRDAVANLDRSPWTPLSLGELAHAAALAGDADTAVSALRAAGEARTAAFELLNPLIDLAEAWVLAVTGRLREARAAALRTARRARSYGFTGFEAAALHDAMRLGAEPAVNRLTALSEMCEGPLTGVFARHARALAGGDVRGLLGAADGFEELGLTLHAADAVAQAARISPAAGDRARRLANRCDGAVTPAVRALSVPELTDREHQIAELAARGATSREIAAALVLSVRTVDNHLSRAYAKLGVTGRAELARLMRAGRTDVRHAQGP
ncbi:helix-turn-helix transcriptional regulator [Actinoallomurus rhizosphaericola]|uniref:helix-turn-helix transcriptional regulator n=1 Tax=Actinoallomurus rhizosphaericola TaxID=2952536 RepID=UPI0020930825|nr:LuxR family transcriptional regulator [Actinoallomurus rhizosphaericola]MCO5999480.1 LuxR C-terminal-related transcriptional regulator [Actinoallomurus rhizosphaericola]